MLIAECIYLVIVGSRCLIMDANFPASFIPRGFGESENDNMPFLGDRGILKQPRTFLGIRGKNIKTTGYNAAHTVFLREQ